jgi:hypothetical protein
MYHLPSFLDRVREQGGSDRREEPPNGKRGGTTGEQGGPDGKEGSSGAHAINDEIDLDLGGVLYHHRGARLPGYDATFIWRGDTFELELDAVGPRSAWAVFDAEQSWDFYIRRAAGDQPCLVWMTDGEFQVEESDKFDSKREAVGLDRFSFGIYLHAPRTWDDLEARARSTDAPVFVHRPDGRTFVPEEHDLDAIADVLPEELRPNDETPPEYLGVLDAHVDAE